MSAQNTIIKFCLKNSDIGLTFVCWYHVIYTAIFFYLPPKRPPQVEHILTERTMEESQQQFDKDDYSGLDGQNGENFEQQAQETTEQAVEDGGDQAMETGGSGDQEDDNEDERYRGFKI